MCRWACRQARTGHAVRGESTPPPCSATPAVIAGVSSATASSCASQHGHPQALLPWIPSGPLRAPFRPGRSRLSLACAAAHSLSGRGAAISAISGQVVGKLYRGGRRRLAAATAHWHAVWRRRAGAEGARWSAVTGGKRVREQATKRGPPHQNRAGSGLIRWFAHRWGRRRRTGGGPHRERSTRDH